MTCQWSWKRIAKPPYLVAMVWPMVWLLLPVFEGVAVLDFAWFAPFCGHARAPADSARPWKQREQVELRVFFNIHRLGIGNVPLQKWKSTSWAQAALLLVQSSFWPVERRLSPPGWVKLWIFSSVQLDSAQTNLKVFLLLKQTLWQKDIMVYTSQCYGEKKQSKSFNANGIITDKESQRPQKGFLWHHVSRVHT